ncbi:MAG TPA: SGNH/GDSL hydrolase family protein [Capsulimonadaceae bacterium]|jgi:lysophospholipase L1-like esterase
MNKHSNLDIHLFSPGARILFQGDSITDGNRGRTLDPNHILGHGYAFIIAARHGAAFPERELTFLNRGVSGNTVVNLRERWTADTVDLEPTVLSILVGVNDAGRAASGEDIGSIEQFARDYDSLLADTLNALPNLTLVLCEPFLASADKTSRRWREVQGRQEVVASLADKHNSIFVPLQHVIDEACERAPSEYWLWDGVHPTYSGHQLIADEWEQTVRLAAVG